MSNKPERGVIATFTGPSGVGKTTVAKKIFEKDPAFEIVPSITTRKPRDSDILGEYIYVSRQEFLKMKARGKFLWNLELHGNYYGTRVEDVDVALALDKISFMLLMPDVLKILRSYSDRVVSYFITVNDESVLRQRLSDRGESEADIEARIMDCRKWERDARTGEISYTFINNNGSLNEVSDILFRLILFEAERIKNL